MKEGLDIRAYDLLNLRVSDSPAAELIRAVCDAWVDEDLNRRGPGGPRIGTVYIETDEDRTLIIRLVTRIKIKGDEV